MTNLITVEEFQQYAPEINLTQYANATVSGFISMATQQVINYIGYDPIAHDVVGEVRTGVVTSEADLLIYPSVLPIITLNSLSLTKGPTDMSVGLTNGQGADRYNIDFQRRSIRVNNMDLQITGDFIFRNFYYLRGNQFYTKISYRGGFEPSALPMVFKLATSLFMRDIISLQNNPTGASRITQGNITIEYKEGDSDSDSDLVRDAKKILRSYRRIG